MYVSYGCHHGAVPEHSADHGHHRHGRSAPAEEKQNRRFQRHPENRHRIYGVHHRLHAMSAVVNNFSTIFNMAFGIEGVTTQVEVATALALDTYGTEVAMVFVLGFLFNLLFAKYTPFKAIFLTGQHFLYFACVLALVFIAHDAPFWLTTIGGGLLLGFFGAAIPTLCQPYMNKIVGADNLAIGHFNTIGYAFSGWVGKMVAKLEKGKETKDTSAVKMPKFFQLFRDFVFSVALFMVVLFYVAVIAAAVNGHLTEVQEMAGTDI